MKKSEQELMDALRAQLREACALGFSSYRVPERMPIPDVGYVNGWDFNPYACWAVPCATGCSSHHYDTHIVDGQKSPPCRQNGLRLFATRRDALIALRLVKEKEFAQTLADIDDAIETEHTKGTET